MRSLLAVVLVIAAFQFSDATSIIDSAKILLVHQNYSAAELLLFQCLKSFPDDNEARYLILASEQTRIVLDYESYLFDGQKFINDSKKAIIIFQNSLPGLHGQDSIRCLYYLGNTFGGISVVQIKNNDWFNGVKNALTSVSLLKQVRKADPLMYEAYLGIGIYNYYLSTSLQWLPFVDNVEKGLQDIQVAMRSSFPYRLAAVNSMCWILIDRKQMAKADSLAATALDEIPDNTIFLSIRAEIAFWNGNYSPAIALGQKILALSQKRSPINWADLISANYILVNAFEKTGRHREALSCAGNILSRHIPDGYLSVPHIKRELSFMADFWTANHLSTK